LVDLRLFGGDKISAYESGVTLHIGLSTLAVYIMISPHTEGDDALPLTDGEIVYTAFTVTWNAESYLSTL
jgi:hypothetical protein